MMDSYTDSEAIKKLEETIANLEVTLADTEDNLNAINAEIQMDPESEINLRAVKD